MNILEELKKPLFAVGADVSPEFRRTLQFFYILVIGGLIVISLHNFSLQSSAISILWALASFASGAAIGFLFGVPKVLQGRPGRINGTQANTKAQEYQQQVNTNLTEISDWLTKIIVGLSLINLRSLPPQLVVLADILAKSLNASDIAKERPFALAVTVFFGVVGFLFGYLATRLFLAGAFLKADTSGLENKQAELQVQLASLQSSQGLLGASLGKQSQAAADTPPTSGDAVTPGIDEQLLAMARAYGDINATDWSERVRLKDDLAARMGDYAIKAGVPRGLLVAKALESSNDTSESRKAAEGLILTLATIINFAPEPGDLDKLLHVASVTKRLHVQYRVVVAFSRLFQTRLAVAKDKQTVFHILDLYQKTADGSLSKLITSTRLSIESLTEPEGRT